MPEKRESYDPHGAGQGDAVNVKLVLHRMGVACAVRQSGQPDGRWLLTALSRLEDVLELPSVDCQLPISEVYEQVELVAGEASPWSVTGGGRSQEQANQGLTRCGPLLCDSAPP